MPRTTHAFTFRDLALLRLRNQRLIDSSCATPEELVGWLGAVQSQDYHGAKWAIGQRVVSATDALIERAFDAGAILRTHVLRPTWHFVLPADLRWLLALTAPRIRAAMRYNDRQLGLANAEIERSQVAIGGALAGGKSCTRVELGRVLQEAGVDAVGLRLGQLLMHAELSGVICSGPRRGKQFTYARLADRAAPAPARSREAALAELTRRYFASHGPALPEDFAWWSGLTLRDAKAGIEGVRDGLAELAIEGRTYWHAGSAEPPRSRRPLVHLLPNYDELVVAYKDRSALFEGEQAKRGSSRMGVLANPPIMLGGRVIGSWRRTLGRPAEIELTLNARLDATARKALDAARARLTQFLA